MPHHSTFLVSSTHFAEHEQKYVNKELENGK